MPAHLMLNLFQHHAFDARGPIEFLKQVQDDQGWQCKRGMTLPSRLINHVGAYLSASNGHGGIAMDLDHDRQMLIRAELSDLLEALRLTSFDTNPLQFLVRLEAIRQTANAHQFAAVAEIASVFEASMGRVVERGGADSVIGSFTGILSDAIGCSQLSPAVTQSLLASVAVRLPN